MRKVKIKNAKGKTIRKENVYSSGPLYYLYEGKDDSKFSLLEEYYKESDPLKSLWMSYYGDVIYRNINVHEDKSHDMYEICRNIESSGFKREFLLELIKKEYNPYEPLPELSENIKHHINKIQNFLKTEYGYMQAFNANGKQILVMYDVKGKEAKLYLKFVDAIVLYRYNHTYILTKDNPEDIFKRLQALEPFWKLTGKTIHSNGKRTGLEFKSEKLLERIF